MISRPNNMSRRGFVRNVLGITTALILPARSRILIDASCSPRIVISEGDEFGLSGLIFNRNDLADAVKAAAKASGVWEGEARDDWERFAVVQGRALLSYFRRTNPNKAFTLA